MAEEKLKVVVVSPEFFPLAKTGGLADFTSALSGALSAMGHQVNIFLPFYQVVHEAGIPTKEVSSPVEVAVGSQNYQIKLFACQVPGNASHVYLLDCPALFDRPELYRDPQTSFDYSDNDVRVIAFCRGVLEHLKRLEYRPNVIHANEWQSALVCAFLKTLYRDDRFFSRTGSVLSLHNLAYQGIFPKSTLAKVGDGGSLSQFASSFEHHDKLNFLKAGILCADVLNTVSETYAVEIQSAAQYGHGLEGILRTRNNDLYGIPNGVDYSQWSPDSDTVIPFRYDATNLSGKQKNKDALFKQCGFASDKLNWPALGIVSRLVEQKGLDLILEVAEELFVKDLVMVLLGTGDAKYVEQFRKLEARYPDRVKVIIAFDEKMAHLIEAGCDIYLMPSRYEPCGLNQLYSLRYGTVPVARATGGLVDTIADFQPGNEGTGFLFRGYNSEEFLQALERALKCFQDKKIWAKIQQNGMKQDFSWKRETERYLELYRLAMKN